MKKETLAEKTRRKLKEYVLPKKKEGKVFEGNIGATISKVNRRRKALEDSLKY